MRSHTQMKSNARQLSFAEGEIKAGFCFQGDFWKCQVDQTKDNLVLIMKTYFIFLFLVLSHVEFVPSVFPAPAIT